MTDLIDFEALSGIGLGASLRQHLADGVADPAARLMRLVEIQREHLLLHDGRSAHRARCSKLLAQDLQLQREALAVGDWVLARPRAAGTAEPGWDISCRLLPQRQIARRTARRAADDRVAAPRQVLVSNVDTALLIMGLDGDFNLRRLERYLALVRLAGVAAVLVLSKADALPPSRLAALLDQARGVLPVEVVALALDLRQAAAAVALAPWLTRGQTLVLLGSSGAGKSTLANTLLAAHGDGADGGPDRRASASVPLAIIDANCARYTNDANDASDTTDVTDVTDVTEATDATDATDTTAASDATDSRTRDTRTQRATAAPRADDSRGRHTTTVRTLLPLPGGACLIDTPGLRALRLDLDQVGPLAEAFGDVARWAPCCRFRDCQHHQEPGCAVREAVPEARLRNFHKLLREAGRDTQSLRQRRTQLTAWKSRSRDAQLRLRAKRGIAP